MRRYLLLDWTSIQKCVSHQHLFYRYVSLRFLRIYYEQMPGRCYISRFDVGLSIIDHEPFCYLPNITFISKWNKLKLYSVFVKHRMELDFIAEYSLDNIMNNRDSGKLKISIHWCHLYY